MKSITKHFINLFFPKNCVVCGINLMNHEQGLCLRCLVDLPKTNFHHQKDNFVAKLFWGKVNIESATAYYFYRKHSKYQEIIHHLKYNNNTDAGLTISKKLANELMNTDFEKIDVIIPVPLHKKRQRKRGYNQSEIIANGISEVLQKPISLKSICRNKNTKTQTNRTRIGRWENVKDIFSVINPDNLKNKHILLVDDVVTTGATLEAIALKILEIPGTKVSIATLAVAVQ